MSKESTAEPKWIPVWLRQSWVRDWICPLFTLIVFYPQVNIWLLLASYGLTGAALSTYWDKLFKFDNFWFHGFMIGLALFPLVWGGVGIWPILLRSIVLAICMGAWSELVGKAYVEEMGRGAFMPLTLLVL